MKWRKTDKDNPIVEFLVQHADNNSVNTMTAQADKLGCSTQYLSDVYNGRRTPGPDMLEKLNVVKEVKVTYRWR